MKTKIEQICPVCESDLQAIKYEPWVDEDDPDKLMAPPLVFLVRSVWCLVSPAA